MSGVPTDPATVMGAINSDVKALDTAGRELGKAIKRLSKAEADYEQELQKALIEIRDEYARKSERLPAEDLRRAIAHQRVLERDNKLYAEFLTAKAQVESLQAWVRVKSNTVSARQSLLSALKAEVRA